ncbi:NHL domain-containing protein [Striga asiatica]|uniref:NHL domain-containing protein n=1 Tax=Striga asiatica TaxID=4170 RepID=A0A5A7R8Q8_STRAF|nr:NHL domain-containing protein [Striga asiatica]
MRSVVFFLVLLVPLNYFVFNFQAQAAPAGPLIKHLSSFVKWTRSSSKTPHQSDGNVLQFEEGYLVETVVEGSELGVEPYSIRVSHDGELFAVDAINSKIVRITPPLSQYSRARLVAGSFQGYTGHVDGKPSDARFNHPKGVTMDDRGNVYVADTSNLAIRKIGEAGVTTIAGGKSSVAGYRDGPSEDAKFSNDFDVIYVRSTCSLLVIDRGNAALRQISLSKEDCGYENSSVSPTDLLMVAGAILIGYASGILQQGFGSSLFSKKKNHPWPKPEDQSSPKDGPEAGWPSFGQLVWDLGKLAFESLGSIFFHFHPLRNIPKRGLTPLKDSLVMPEDEPGPSSFPLKQQAPIPISEARQAQGPSVPSPNERFSEVKPVKIRSSSAKDPALSTKHRSSSRRHEFAEFYGSSEAPQYGHVRSKSHKERAKHRSKEKSGETMETRPAAEVEGPEYENTIYDPYNFRSRILKYANVRAWRLVVFRVFEWGSSKCLKLTVWRRYDPYNFRSRILKYANVRAWRLVVFWVFKWDSKCLKLAVCLEGRFLVTFDRNKKKIKLTLAKANMGCSVSSQAKAGGNVKKIRKPKAWKHPQPITRSQLIQLREEFWDTAPHYGGTKEIWDALREAAESDITLAQAILDSAGILVHTADLTVCFDERGARYELPKYVLSEPKNLIEDP